jgi:hypothetical protein
LSEFKEDIETAHLTSHDLISDIVSMVLFPVFLCYGLLLVIIDAATLLIKTPVQFQHNTTLHRRNNINKYGGCDKKYTAGSGKDLVYKAYQDMLKIT